MQEVVYDIHDMSL